MSDELAFRVAELERRLRNLILYGVVHSVNYPAARVRVEAGELKTGWVPWMTTRAMSDATWWAPRIGEQVVLFSPCGDPAQGVALPAVYQDAAPAPESDPDKHLTVYPDGAFIEHDSANHVTTFYTPGDYVFLSDGDFSVLTGGNVNLNPHKG